MTVWAVAAAVYGVAMAVAAVAQPIRRRSLAFAASLAYALVALAAGTVGSVFLVAVIAPGLLLLTGYWLSGFFFHAPQAWLEEWLLRVDAAVLGSGRARCATGRGQVVHVARPPRAPRWLRELLELSYAADYVVIGGGAIYAATFGTDAVSYFWSLVIASELASFAPLPWLRSRPPRVLEARTGAGVADDHAEPGYFRRLNTAILDHASVQANTIPSGHVSGAVAAAFGVLAVDPVAGWGMMTMAGVIAVGAVAGRYHYVVDCVAGAAVAAAFWSVM
jgi:hypothetical protein